VFLVSFTFRCFGSTTRCVTARATGSTTTWVTSPQMPSEQLATVPMVNCSVSGMRFASRSQSASGMVMWSISSTSPFCPHAVIGPHAFVGRPIDGLTVPVSHLDH
jgi:hypothetical protein